jgi:membrane-bound ClpP family serine protease
VFVHGESWEAYSDEVIESGEEIEVIEVKGLKVKVARKTTK